MSSPTPKLQRIDAFDGLRGLAAVQIVLGHMAGAFHGLLPATDLLGGWLHAGNFAGGLFFLISGFVTTRLANRSGPELTYPSYLKFLVGRVERLFPTYLAGLLAVVLLVVGASFLLVQLFNRTPAPGEVQLVAYTSPQGQVREVALPDGSRMTLDANSAVTGRFGGDERALTLERGRALFDVKPDPAPDSYHFTADSGLPDCPQLKMLRVNGSLFFGAVDHVHSQLEEIDRLNSGQKHVLIAASGINFVDMAGAEMLAREARRRRALGGGLYIYRMKDAVRRLLVRSGHLADIGEENLFPVKSRPIAAIYRRLDPEICRNCKVRVFAECQTYLPNGEPRAEASQSSQRI